MNTCLKVSICNNSAVILWALSFNTFCYYCCCFVAITTLVLIAVCRINVSIELNFLCAPHNSHALLEKIYIKITLRDLADCLLHTSASTSASATATATASAFILCIFVHVIAFLLLLLLWSQTLLWQLQLLLSDRDICPPYGWL